MRTYLFTAAKAATMIFAVGALLTACSSDEGTPDNPSPAPQVPGALANIQPHELFNHFEAICAIPRASGHCTAIASYVQDYARRRGS